MKAAKTTKQEDGYKLQTLADLGELQFVSSGIKEIDELSKFPRGRITEIHGMQGIGKTELATLCIASMSKEGRVLYVDAENALNPQRLREKGAEAKNVDISDLHILEDVAKCVADSIGKYDVIVVDSVASLLPKSEAEGQTGDQFVGLRARLMGQWMRQIVGRLGKSKTALVFINQLRESMSMYGDPLFTPGGKALPYAASLRLKLSTTKADRIVKDGVTVGHWVQVEITKSRVSAPYLKTKFKLTY